MSGERLANLTARLDAVRERPLADHPDALDDLHRALVAELESLATAGAGQGEEAGRPGS